MTSQVVFKIDKRLKDKAMKKAKQEGTAFSYILKLATQAFVSGNLNIRLVTEEKFNAKTRKELDKALQDIKEGKNLSPSFTNVDDAINYLKDLT